MLIVSRNVTLCVRPCLAAVGRWSVDYWFDGDAKAAYQYWLITFDSVEMARQGALQAKAELDAHGNTVQIFEENKNASRDSIPAVQATEDELSKHLQKYVEKSYEPVRTMNAASFFEIGSWAKRVNALAQKSPVVFSLLTLALLIFRGPLGRLLGSIPLGKLLFSFVPNELGLKPSQLLECAPLLILVTALYVRATRRKESVELNRVRVWILRLAVFFDWDYFKFLGLITKEFGQLEYASYVDQLASVEKRNPASFTNVVNQLTPKLDGDAPDKADKFVRTLVRDDFARKMQGLAGLGGEHDYNARDLAVLPLHLLLSNNAVKTVVMGLIGATTDGSFGPAGVLSARRDNERAAVTGVKLGIVLMLVVVGSALVWTTALAWKVSWVLFALDVVASLATFWLLMRRPVAVGFQHKFIPRGLELHECVGAMKIDVA
jgi:hypothetical protein